MVQTPALYLDTSVLGGYFDDEWKEPTQELWRQMERGQWLFFTSLIAAVELTEAILDVTGEMDELADAYVVQAVVTPKYHDDARHVAVCTAARLDYLVSWNFRHLVNVQREAGFNGVNLLKGYPPVRIVNPLELIYGNQEESL